MVWARLMNIGHDKDHPARPSYGSKKTRKTAEEVGGQHQRVDRPGLLRDTGWQTTGRSGDSWSSVVPQRHYGLWD